jgi:voltage-gated potassium channel
MREHTGALVLALRDEDGTFRTNPPPDTEIRSGQVIIAIGTQEELDALVAFIGR